MVVIGSVAGLIFLIVILILVSNRNRGKIEIYFRERKRLIRLVRRWKICMIVTIVTIIIQSLLMLGLVLCIAHCSGFISLTSTAIDKGRESYFPYRPLIDLWIIILDVIAALIASIIAAISIMFFNVINYLLGRRHFHSIFSTITMLFSGYIGQDRVHAGGPIPVNSSVLIKTKHKGLFFIDCSLITKVSRRATERIMIELNVRLRLLIHVSSMNSILISLNPCININWKADNMLSMKAIIFLMLNLIDEVQRREKKSPNVSIDLLFIDLTQAMLSQEPHNLETAIARVKASNHSEALADEINQAENLLNQLR